MLSFNQIILGVGEPSASQVRVTSVLWGTVLSVGWDTIRAGPETRYGVMVYSPKHWYVLKTRDFCSRDESRRKIGSFNLKLTAIFLCLI